MALFHKKNEQRELNDRFLWAIRVGDIEDVGAFLDEGAEIEARGGWNYWHQTALLMATVRGRADIVSYLLDRGADIKATCSEGKTAMFLAAAGGYTDIVETLLQHEAQLQNVNFPPHMDALREAMRVEHLEIVEKLILDMRKKSGAPASFNPDEVIFEQKIDNRILQEIFNFSSLERISLVRKSSHGEVEAVARHSFADIENLPQLRKAFDEHVRRGGKTAENIVFPSRLFPVRLPPRNDFF